MLSRPYCFLLGRDVGPRTKRKRRVYKTRRAHSAYPVTLRSEGTITAYQDSPNFIGQLPIYFGSNIGVVGSTSWFSAQLSSVDNIFRDISCCPEPSSVVLLGIGLLGMSFKKRGLI